MKTIRLILGDQLNQNHSWFNTIDNDVVYLMAEMRQETDYVKHHIQKVVAFFLAMRNFKKDLSHQGHHFIYLELNDPNNLQDLEKVISMCIKENDVEKFEYQLPDEYRLDQQLLQICESLEIKSSCVDTEHFYTTRFELKDFYKGKKQMVMENFYRMMRKKHQIMMINDQPEGGKWNFDQNNRKKWTGQPAIPSEKKFNQDVLEIIQEVKKANV
ncbi:MAG: cryptochrome/photolyase family protein, partial [Maribacter arcticus]